MSIDLLELAADNHGEMLGDVVFVGRIARTLDSDPGAPPVRPIKDVDVIVEVATRSEFHDVEGDCVDSASMKTRRTVSSVANAPRQRADPRCDAVCSRILGFANRWQGRRFHMR